MKKILNTFYKSKIFIAVISSFVALSCNEFLDVDTDTDSPTVAATTELLTNIQLGLSSTNDFDLYSGNILITYTHQFTFREEQDQYGAKADNINMNNEWDNTYLTLTDMETLFAQAEIDGDLVHAGVTKIMKAYLMSVTVDLWGDVPYSEATQLEFGIVSPKFDDQEEIYASILALIDAGKANVLSGQGTPLGSEDLFYAGDTEKWVRFANTLKFKLYNQLRSTALFNQSDLDALVSENNFFKSSADDFQFTHSPTQSPLDERNSLFLDCYGGTQVSYYQSPWFYEILKGMNPNIFTGYEDPRIPYYFVNQLKPGELPPDQGNAETGDPNADYWDASTGFFSIRFGSIGPDRDHAVQKSASFPGIFPCGGFYDDGSGPTITIASGTGVAPKRILTYDEFLYIQAELIHDGVISGDASAKLKEAMTASFAKVDEVVLGTGTSQTVPVLSGTPEVTSFIDDIIAEYDGASAEKQLEIIMTQKWVATFGDPMDQYNDYRRTGYPVLANPLGASPEYQLNNDDGFPLDDGVTVQNNGFQQSFFWPQAELNTNENAPSQKDATSYTIFWAN
ncbi:SusD/RagB family nutrient-binding outer membrane lipoprotein [uncultured Lutibacter sp.]|uniref:SusD/RagB family nutrient-binding outer membrane lipoprotein n=1 Tax=uncultured Lutibacter sp. TaxID=437739 RepID=UPI002609D0CE|nr:SusD/RagB family nutrient-binding outer membrane lipoprotein [uncultured Lutibacter sp.]